MTRTLYRAAFAAGLLVIGWIGAGYLQTHPLALAMTGLIGAFFLMGVHELQRFRRDTRALGAALGEVDDPPASIDDWIARLPASCRPVLRGRLDGERIPLPGPAVTPYLAGLLVLLGMLGTFLGMVVTLQGTGTALQAAIDLSTMREALAAPIRGLGLAFGTSVAGVAASAMLGLMSTLSRSERAVVSQQLEARLAGSLRVFGAAHRREESFRLMQRQAEGMPALVEAVQGLIERLEGNSQRLETQLREEQQRFHREAEVSYRGLAERVEVALHRSVDEGARAAAASIPPLVEATMAGITRETARLHADIAGTADRQLAALTNRIGAQTQAWLTDSARQHATLGAGMSSAVQEIARESASLRQSVADSHVQHVEAIGTRLQATADRIAGDVEQRAAALLAALGQAQADARRAQAAEDQSRLTVWTGQLEAMAAALSAQWQQAAAEALTQQQRIVLALERGAREAGAQAEAQSRATIREIGALVEAAAQAPRAAAELVAQLRQQLSDSLVRDTALLEERSRITATLDALLDSLTHASSAQRSAIDTLVGDTASLLKRLGADVGERLGAAGERLDEAGARLGASAIEVASLGEAFGQAVERFARTGEQLGTQLQRIEGALGQSLVRSDEQLGYYVAQARELIDLSVMSQKQIVDELQRLAAIRPALASEA